MASLATDRGSTIIIGRHCEYDWDTEGLTDKSVRTLAQSAWEMALAYIKPSVILTSTVPTHVSTGWLLKQLLSPGNLNAIPLHTVEALNSHDWIGSSDSDYAILSKCLRVSAPHDVCAIITTKEVMHRLILSLASTIFTPSNYDHGDDAFKDFGRFVAISYNVPKLGDLHPVRMIYEQKKYLQHVAPIQTLVKAERKGEIVPFDLSARKTGDALQLAG